MVEKIDELIAAFNRGSLDVPNGFLTPHTSYSLNGRSYESLLGGSPDDPLIRLLARGPAGYRTAAKMVMYALQGPLVAIETMSEAADQTSLRAMLRIDGRLRPNSDTFAMRLEVEVRVDGQRVRAVSVKGTDEDLATVARARQG